MKTNEQKKPSISGYELIEQIGTGQYAVVWKARQLSLDRTVALKLLSSDHIRDAEMRQYFLDAARTAAQVKHPGLVQIYDAGQENGITYIAMEYMAGFTLEQLLKSKPQLMEKHAFSIAEGVARALSYAWEHASLIHGSLSPKSIMIDADGSIKVADLGIAVQGGRYSSIIPNYASPEQAAGNTELNFQTDIYALGAIFYQLVTGTCPFALSSDAEVLEEHQRGFLPDPLDIQPGLSIATSWFVEKMMVRDRALRYSSWGEFIEDIQAVQNGFMPVSSLPGVNQSTVKRSDKRREVANEQSKIATEFEAPSGKKKVRIKKTMGGEKSEKQGITLPAEAQEQLRYQRQIRTREQARKRKQESMATRHFVWLGILALLVMGGYGLLYIEMTAPAEEPAVEETAQAGKDVVTTMPKKAPESMQQQYQRQYVENASTEEPAAQKKNKSSVAGWNDPRFVAGAKAFNRAYDLYAEYQKSKTNPVVLDDVEKLVRYAIDKFEDCKNDAPAHIKMDRYLQNCYHLLSNTRQSKLIE